MMIYTILVCFGLISLSQCKRYDVEAEGKKLYGNNENFNSLLRGFRRTPEYKRVLEKKVASMLEHFNEIANIYFAKYSGAAQMEGLTNLDLLPSSTSTTPAAIVHIREGNRLFNKEMRQKKEPYMFKPNRRAVDFEQLKPEFNMSDQVYILNFVKFSQQLSTAQNNKLKDIAFKAYGHCIHEIIRAMKNDVQAASTKQPIGSKEVEGSTDNHLEDHGTTVLSTTKRDQHIP